MNTTTFLTYDVDDHPHIEFDVDDLFHVATLNGVGEQYTVFGTPDPARFLVRVVSGPVSRWVGQAATFADAVTHVATAIQADMDEMS
jgi:hypothetical protein